MTRHCLRPRRRGRRDWPLEQLDDRRLLSLFLVTSAGDDGPGTLRAAIEQANLQPGSTVEFRVRGTITLSSALPDLSADVTIGGPGVSGVTVERSPSAGTPLFSIFTVAAYADDIRATRLRQHGLDVPDDPDLGHPAH